MSDGRVEILERALDACRPPRRRGDDQELDPEWMLALSDSILLGGGSTVYQGREGIRGACSEFLTMFYRGHVVSQRCRTSATE